MHTKTNDMRNIKRKDIIKIISMGTPDEINLTVSEIGHISIVANIHEYVILEYIICVFM